MLRSISRSLSILIVIPFVCLTTVLEAQQQGGDPPTAIVIERAALTLKSRESFKVQLELKPVRELPVVAPVDGIIQDVFVKVGDRVQQQAELIRLNSQEFTLALRKSQAAFELAKLVVSQATAGKEKLIAEAQQEVAKREVELAQFRVDQTIRHAAIEGQVIEVRVIPGQYVRAGELLAKVIDPKQLFVQIPVERDQFDPSKPFPLTIEASTTDAIVDGLLPPLPEFNPLRELFVSVATARLLVDSQNGKFTAGQSVTSAMVPRFPIAEIQTLALKTATSDPTAERAVQVIRQGFVRTLPVQLLGQVGQTHLFVSGRFVEGDELIISSSQELKEGSWIRPLLVEEQTPTPGRNRPTPGTNLPAPSGF